MMVAPTGAMAGGAGDHRKGDWQVVSGHTRVTPPRKSDDLTVRVLRTLVVASASIRPAYAAILQALQREARS
jgi:outer membrane protein W